MIKSFPILTLVLQLFLFTGCLKNSTVQPCTPRSAQSEQSLMASFANANSINYTIEPTTGIFYEVIAEGTGSNPSPSSKIFVTYVGKLTSNGTVVDSQTDPSKTGWVLETLIPGWQAGIPLIKKGGTIKLIIPSILAYGCAGYAKVPPDAVLYFEITLVDVQ